MANKLHIDPITNFDSNLSARRPSPKPSKLANYIRVYFDFAYYLCICPFRFQENGNNLDKIFSERFSKPFSVYKWRPQQVIQNSEQLTSQWLFNLEAFLALFPGGLRHYAYPLHSQNSHRSTHQFSRVNGPIRKKSRAIFSACHEHF